MVGATDVAPLSVMIFARLDEMGKNYQMNDDVVVVKSDNWLFTR